jgi:hypothetical protein
VILNFNRWIKDQKCVFHCHTSVSLDENYAGKSKFDVKLGFDDCFIMKRDNDMPTPFAIVRNPECYKLSKHEG